jgi:hypothetical protein
MRLRITLAVPVLALLACTSSNDGGVASAAPTVIPSAATSAAPPSGSVEPQSTVYANWPTYHGSNYRGGYAATMPAVSGAPRVVKKLALDGAVYASPIVINGIVIVATENDTVYAFNSSYTQLWKRHLGTPSPGSERPCGNIDPLGITGTPAYDATRNSVYVAPEYSGSPPRHELVSLNFTTGAVRWHRTLDLPGVDQKVMQERGALAVVGSRVYVPFGGLAGDCGQYKGRVVGYSTSGSGNPVSFTVPTTREAGIWTPPGPSADSSGHIYVSVGNGASGLGDPYDYSDSVLTLSTSLALTDSFSPTTWASDNAADLDLGSQGPALVGSWIFIAGKSGTAYVLRRNDLGGIGGQVSKTALCRSFGGTARNNTVVYVPCTDGVRAVRIDSLGKMHVLWHASSSITGSPIVGGGRVWSLNVGSGVLNALDPATGGSKASVTVGAVTRFATPAAFGRRLFVPTIGGLTVVATS